MNTATAPQIIPAQEKAALAPINEQDQTAFVTVPETTLLSGQIVPAFLVGRYACSKDANGRAVVTPDLKPWHSINYFDAIKACGKAGVSLITESQYLALAYQITQQDANWTGGKVGDGEVYRGLHQWKVNQAQDGHYESQEAIERRWHVLANGERVYDMAGNLFSWVFDDVQGDEKGVIAKPFTDDSISKTTCPYESGTHGMGSSWVGPDWSGLALVRGGCWRSDRSAGVFCVGYVWPRGDRDYVGFRCTKSP